MTPSDRHSGQVTVHPPAAGAADRPRARSRRVLGGAWLVGALHAIATETGWDPGSADRIVGTSAGSVAAALLACGAPPWLMVAHSAGDAPDGADRRRRRPADGHGGRRPPVPACTAAARRSGPGSWRLALGSLARRDRYPRRHDRGRLAAAGAGLRPSRCGPRSAATVPATGLRTRAAGGRDRLRDRAARRVRRARVPAPTSPTPWRRRARSPASTGRSRSPAAATWTAACARVEPRRAGGRRASTSVICINPTSSPRLHPPRTLGERLVLPLRQAASRRVCAPRRRASGIAVPPWS